jgi:hypothetical protein
MVDRSGFGKINIMANDESYRGVRAVDNDLIVTALRSEQGRVATVELPNC